MLFRSGKDVANTFDWKTRTGSYLGPSFLIDFLTPDEYWHFVGQTYDLSEATMLISSHDLGHVTDVSDRIAILEAGEIVRDEPTDPDTLEDLTTYFAEAIRPKETEPAEA